MHLLISTSYLPRLTYTYNLSIYVSSVKKFKEIDYNMLGQNHVQYKYVVHENHLMGWWCNGKGLDSSMWSWGVQIPALATEANLVT
jgi:hypothetical protein